MTREASERLLALARHAARICHDWQFDAAENIDEIDAGHKGGFGGFDTCPHPDCVLVRTPVAPDGWQGLDRCESCPHHRVNHPGGPCVLCPCKQFAAAPREEPTA